MLGKGRGGLVVWLGWVLVPVLFAIHALCRAQDVVSFVFAALVAVVVMVSWALEFDEKKRGRAITVSRAEPAWVSTRATSTVNASAAVRSSVEDHDVEKQAATVQH